MFGIDTNIFVYANDSGSPFYEAANTFFSSLLGKAELVVPNLVLLEFYSVITDGRKISHPLMPDDASGIIDDIVHAPEFLIISSFEGDPNIVFRNATIYNVLKYDINDFCIAWSLTAHGVKKLYTANIKDFKKFDFIESVNPFEATKPFQTETKRVIPYGRQTIDEKDVASVCDTLRSPWLTTGPKVEEFERAVSEYCDANHGIAVSSGTAALHCAMYALGVGPGDEVIVPPVTFAATANCVCYQGGVPVFADVHLDTLLIDPDKIQEKITKKTKAIIAVDFAGHPCDYDKLRSIADKNGLALIADACHSLGAEYKGRKVGSLADMTIFSFHPVKHITTGEGGMITTDDPELARRICIFRNHGISKDFREREKQGDWFYEMIDLGYNYRISDIQCALGFSQLGKLPEFLKRRREIAAQYDAFFSNIRGISPLVLQDDVVHAYHLYVVRIDNDYGFTRKEVFNHLRNNNIVVNIHYIPVYLHPYYRRRFGCKKGVCPVAESGYEEILSLPVHYGMTDEEVSTVISVISELTQ